MAEKRELFFFEWVVVDNCNLFCTYCVNKGADSHKSKEEMSYVKGLEVDIARKIQELSKSAARVIVNLTGGEPLLSNYLIEVLRILASAENVSVNVISNLKRLGAVADDILRVFPALNIHGSLHVAHRSDEEIDELIALLNKYKGKLKISLSQVNHELTERDQKILARIREQTGRDIQMQTFIPPWTEAGKVENSQKISDANFVTSLGKRCCLGYSHFIIQPNGAFQYNLWCDERTRRTGKFLSINADNFSDFILPDMKKCPRTSCGCNYNIYNYSDYSAACQRLGYPPEEIFGPDNIRRHDEPAADGRNVTGWMSRFRDGVRRLLTK